MFFSGDITRSGGTERVSTMIANALSRQGKYQIMFLSLVHQQPSPFCCLAAVCTLIWKSSIGIRLPWHLDTAFLLAPYAGLGVLFCTKGECRLPWADTPKKEWFVIAALLAIQTISCYFNTRTGSGHIDYNLLVTHEWISCYLSGITGIMAMVFLCRKLPNFKWLAFVGKNSAIYYCMS